MPRRFAAPLLQSNLTALDRLAIRRSIMADAAPSADPAALVAALARDARAAQALLATLSDEARAAGLGQAAAALRGEIVPGAQSAYQAARTGFELGKFGYLDVLDAQRTFFQAKAQYWKALSTAFQAVADLDRLAGTETPSAE